MFAWFLVCACLLLLFCACLVLMDLLLVVFIVLRITFPSELPYLGPFPLKGGWAPPGRLGAAWGPSFPLAGRCGGWVFGLRVFALPLFKRAVAPGAGAALGWAPSGGWSVI
jgi:hypothetical protein